SRRDGARRARRQARQSGVTLDPVSSGGSASTVSADVKPTRERLAGTALPSWTLRPFVPVTWPS
ncbi:MAG: hypothetical protein ABI533_05170, partial [Betaproteobacteria bacterium]